MTIRDKLISIDKRKYGDRYRGDCLAIYQLYVRMADNISNMRQVANRFFVTLNTAIIAAFSYLGAAEKPWGWAISVVGIALCFAWYRVIRSYKDLNSAKFKVIHEMEKELPLSPYDAEWEAVGRGKDPSLYLPFTYIEMWVPMIFGALHLMVLVATFLGASGLISGR